MATVKTAISLKQTLFNQVNMLADEMNVSRSQLFALAVEEFIRKRESQKLFQKINRAYDDFPDAAEQRAQNNIRQHHRGAVTEQW